MSDDVNRQHMDAMGLGAIPLGVSFPSPDNPPPDEDPDRCPSYGTGGIRCARREGHAGLHARGNLTWALTGPATFPTRTRPEDQVLPSGDESIPDDQSLVIADIEARRQVGIERYGQGHRPFNGRNTILDAYDETLDRAVYLRSLLRLREATRADLIKVVGKALRDEQKTQPFTSWDDAAEAAVNRIVDWVIVYLENDVPPPA